MKGRGAWRSWTAQVGDHYRQRPVIRKIERSDQFIEKSPNLCPPAARLVALADENFTRAAQRCHLTQPAFSALIRQLEDSAGLRLFDRRHATSS